MQVSLRKPNLFSSSRGNMNIIANNHPIGSGGSNVTKVRCQPYHPDLCTDHRMSSGKPECLRCTSTGRRCDGYQPPKTWLFELKGEREPSPGPSFSSRSALASSHSPEESRALQFYDEKTAPTCTNYCSPHFWKVTVLAAAQLHPSVKYITIATAELHASLEELTDQPGLSRLRFMQNYSKAVALLTKGSNSLDTEVILICCLLFSRCENFQGDPMAGLLHIEGGARLLREWRASIPQRFGRLEPQNRNPDLIEQEIAPIIDRIEAQIATSRNLPPGQRQRSPSTTPGEGTPAPETPAKPSIPEAYDTFCMARDQLNDVIQWIRRALSWDSVAAIAIPVHSTSSSQEAKALLAQWLLAFNSYNPQPGGMHEKEFLRRECLLLRAHHRAASIMAESLPSSTSEMVFDDHLDNFKALLKETSAAAIPPTAPSISFHFGFSLGLIPPLFLIATRCREPLLRKEAVAILRSTHRSEGCWDSCSAALIAEHVINIEERGLTVIQSAADITTFSRLRLVGAEVDYPNQQLVLRVARQPFSDGLDQPIEEGRVSWRTVVGQDRDIVEWVSQFQFRSQFRRSSSSTTTTTSFQPDDGSLVLSWHFADLRRFSDCFLDTQPLDKLLGPAGYQGLIRPERGICRHTAAMRIGGEITDVTGDVGG